MSLSFYDFETCFFGGSITDCKSNISYYDIGIGFLLLLPILYFASEMIREYVRTKNKSLKAATCFYITCGFTAIFYITVPVLPSQCTLSTLVVYSHQKIALFTYSLSHLIIADQSIGVLVLLHAQFSNFFKAVVSFFMYINIALIFGVAILSNFPFTVSQRRNTFDVVSSISTFSVLFSRGVFLCATAYAFVFYPRIKELFTVKSVQLMRFLLLIVSFSTLIWVSYLIWSRLNLDPVFCFGSMDPANNTRKALIISLITNIIADYIPRSLFACIMWFLSSVSQNEEDISTVSKNIIDSSDDSL